MIEVVSVDFDERLVAACATARCTYEQYLQMTTGAEENLKIQRGVIKDSKAYRTLRADLRRGCVLPPVVLAVSNLPLQLSMPAIGPGATLKEEFSKQAKKVEAALTVIDPKNVYIIDGLQRTNAIKQTLSEISNEGEKRTFLDRQIRVEVWLNISFGALAYRMLLLNAGQRPMQMKLQVEILSMKLKEELERNPKVEILSSLSGQRRTKPGQFHLYKLSQAFLAWLQGQPNVDVRNAVMEQLVAESAIETLGSSLGGTRSGGEKDQFKELVSWFTIVDELIFSEHPEFLSNETVLQGIAAASGAAERNDQIRPRMQKALTHLVENLKTNPTDDSLAITMFEQLRKGVDTAKVNVGQFTREMVFRAFQEYFLADGTKSMEECWGFAASQL